MYFFLFIILPLLLLLSFVYGGLRGAPWVPMRARDVERVMKLAEINAGQKIYDLGCGDGRVLLAAAERGAEARGFEISLIPYAIACIKWLFFKKRQAVTISFKDFWFANFHDADVVYFFLMPDVYAKLKTKLEQELKSGALVIAYVWPMSGWEPIGVDETPGRP